MGIIDTVYPDGAPVSKANVRSDDKAGHRRNMASAQSVRDNDLSGQTAGIYVRELQQFYDLDTGDTTTPDDGDECIIDFAGNRFKKLAVGGGGSAEVITYDNSTSGLAASDVQTALDEIVANVSSKSDLDYLVNGNGQVDQELASSLSDVTYGHDQWYALTQTAAIAKSSLTDVSDGLPNMMRLTQSQASAQRFGYAQVMEASRIKKLRGKTVSFDGKLRYSNNSPLRFAILEWTGTADSVTKDVVNSWTNSSFTAGQFFNSTTFTVRAVGTITPSAATLTDFLLTATLGSSLNNLILFIWTEGTAAQNSTLDIAASLKQGLSVTPLLFRSMGDELRECQRYFCKSYGLSQAPGDGGGLTQNAGFAWSTTGIFSPEIQFPVRMRVAPTITPYAPIFFVGDTPTAGQWQWYSGGVSNYKNASATAGSNVSDFSFFMNLTVSGATATGAYIINGSWKASARL